MQQKIVALIITCASVGLVFGVSNMRAQQPAEKSARVRIAGETISVQQCLQPLGENRQEERSKLLYRLGITNISDRPIIIYRYPPKAYDARLSRTLADMPNRKFHFEKRPSFTPAPTRNFNDPEPTNESFRVLQPNQSFTYEFPESLELSSTESPDPEKNQLEGQYFLQLKVATWVSEIEKAEKLQQRWAKYGDFVYQDVIAEPFPFTVPKPGVTTARCDSL